MANSRQPFPKIRRDVCQVVAVLDLVAKCHGSIEVLAGSTHTYARSQLMDAQISRRYNRPEPPRGVHISWLLTTYRREDFSPDTTHSENSKF